MRRQALDALSRVDVAHLASATLNTMSTGEVRRVLIARALVHEPRALILDEPTRGLDVVARHQFMERVRAIARAGTTTIVVTHHVEEVVPEIGRVILLAHGRVAHDGPTADVVQAPHLSDVFGARMAVERADGYYYVRVIEGRPAPGEAGR
jgi:iron complex transport system ATP-binding protein